VVLGQMLLLAQKLRLVEAWLHRGRSVFPWAENTAALITPSTAEAKQVGDDYQTTIVVLAKMRKDLASRFCVFPN